MLNTSLKILPYFLMPFLNLPLGSSKKINPKRQFKPVCLISLILCGSAALREPTNQMLKSGGGD